MSTRETNNNNNDDDADLNWQQCNHSGMRRRRRRRRKKVAKFIDCRELAPQNSGPSMIDLLPVNMSTVGSLLIAMPGKLRGLKDANNY